MDFNLKILCEVPSRARNSAGPASNSEREGFIDKEDCPANSNSLLPITGWITSDFACVTCSDERQEGEGVREREGESRGASLDSLLMDGSEDRRDAMLSHES
jgi:hypothetical protein